MNHFEKPSNSNNASKESVYCKPIRKKNPNFRYDKAENKENQYENKYEKSNKNSR